MQDEEPVDAKESNTLMLTEVPEDIAEYEIEKHFKNLCGSVGVALPESVRSISTLGMAYVIFPSISTARTIFKVSLNV